MNDTTSDNDESSTPAQQETPPAGSLAELFRQAAHLNDSDDFFRVRVIRAQRPQEK